jgi:transcriptional regulator with GAF, ATPase, and Fis domain
MESGGYVRKVYEDTQKLVRDLLVQGERLAGLIGTLEEEKRHLLEEIEILRDELESCRGKERVLRGELLTIEEENLRLAGRYGSIERQNSNITNLYVASYRLHGTLDRQEVIATIQEIVANLMGCEEMALFELDPQAKRLNLLASFGIDPEPFRQVPVTRGLVGRAAESGTKIVVDPRDPSDREHGEERLTACIPLVLDGAVVGLIALFRLLPQKTAGYEEVDYELMELLATHAATALYCTALHERRRREAPCA